MRTIWRLVRKDLLRDLRHPMEILVYLSISVIISLIISMVFAPGSDPQENIVIRIAVLDEDEDFISGMLRSLSSQGDESRNMQLHPVDTREEGIRLLEKREVSAFVILPQNLTSDLLDDKPVSIPLYKNPAESILPGIVEQGLEVIAIGVSESLEILRPELKIVRDMFDNEELPDSLEVASVAADSIDRMRTVEPYLFPPLIQFNTVEVSDYVPDSNESEESEESDDQDTQDTEGTEGMQETRGTQETQGTNEASSP